MDRTYLDTVRLLLDVAPEVFSSDHFALKGGTAINLFVQNMPRLSVDLDLVYRDHTTNRDTALSAIGAELQAARQRIAAFGIKSEAVSTRDGDEVKLLLRRGAIQVKIEVNFVFRGTLLPVQTLALAPTPREVFLNNLSLPVLVESELYGSKLVAALDRQHPRDFFDVMGMFQRSGLTQEILQCFLGYLIGHNRPVHEVLFSRDLNFATAFENEFVGMTTDPVTLEALIDTRTRLRSEMLASLTEDHRTFLLGFVKMEPDWSAMPFSHLSEMPAIRWKLQNLARLKRTNPKKFQQQSDALARRFGA
jgi:predicted nucleotidyltransferase component of viral defense system